MYSSECRAYDTAGGGCYAHGLIDCLCDVRPVEGGVPICSVPFPDRLAELGPDRFGFAEWAEEVTAWQDSQGGPGNLRLVAEG